MMQVYLLFALVVTTACGWQKSSQDNRREAPAAPGVLEMGEDSVSLSLRLPESDDDHSAENPVPPVDEGFLPSTRVHIHCAEESGGSLQILLEEIVGDAVGAEWGVAENCAKTARIKLVDLHNDATYRLSVYYSIGEDRYEGTSGEFTLGSDTIRIEMVRARSHGVDVVLDFDHEPPTPCPAPTPCPEIYQPTLCHATFAGRCVGTVCEGAMLYLEARGHNACLAQQDLARQSCQHGYKLSRAVTHECIADPVE